MASEQNFLDFIVNQVEEGNTLLYRKMFGEYAVYYNNKVVALVCDNQLLLN